MKYILVLVPVLALMACTSKFTEKSIVKVTNVEGNSGGTGWVAKSNGKKVIVTNDHVCGIAFAGDTVRIEQDDGTPSLKHIIKRSFTRDLCLVEGVDAPALTIAKNPARRFDKVQVLGHPGLRPTAPSAGVFTGNGIVPIGFNVKPDGSCPDGAEVVQALFSSFCVLQMELGYTTVPIMPGNSGSPITNTDGEVIGVMNSADSTGNQGMFIPLNYLKDILND